MNVKALLDIVTIVTETGHLGEAAGALPALRPSLEPVLMGGGVSLGKIVDALPTGAAASKAEADAVATMERIVFACAADPQHGPGFRAALKAL